MKYEIYDWRVDKSKKGLQTKQKTRSIESKKIESLDIHWFNYENYGKNFLLLMRKGNRLYVVEYSCHIKSDWIKSKLKDNLLFIEKVEKKKREKHENQISLF